MIGPAREAAYELLCRVEMEQAHSDDALNSEVVSRLDPRDRNLATEIVYGTLRWRGWLDHILEGAVAGSWRGVRPETRILLRMTLYQISRMDRMPDHAAVHDGVELAKRSRSKRAAGFVNGVMRSLARLRPWTAADFHRDCPMWARVSVPRWLWKRWQHRFGTDRAFEFALSLNRAPRAAFRRSSGLAADADLPSGFFPSELVPGAFLAGEGHPGRVEGGWFQDEASQLIPHLFGPLEGARVWDACAAPGGKTAILLEKCRPCGCVVSSDMDLTRAARMAAALQGRAEEGPGIVVADAALVPPFRRDFDAVLADVPCSGLGTLRRNPEIRWRVRPDQLTEYSKRQARLLESVSRAVRPGGLLLYSTCSTEPEENEVVVERFLQAHSGFHIRKPEFPAGIGSWLDAQGLFRSYPGGRLWDGFFAALMVRDA